MKFFPGLGLLFVLLCSCGNGADPALDKTPAWDGQTRFEAVPPARSQVTFANELSYDKDFNIYRYRNFYNGGGVALGDVNNDGLTDLYLTGNRVDNRLYLNRGDLVFEDVTDLAGVAGQAAWSTGVTMADVNADGWLDIYVCNSGDIAGDNKQNELFINNQDGTFSERAADFGLADRGLSTHGVFFDYDRDGDLDFYLLNNSYQAIGSFNLERNERPKRDSVGGDKLYRNDGGSFVDVSEQAGIYGSVIGFGLGVTVGDVDRDGWPDIFVSNDFFERDYLYINQQDGTFKEDLVNRINSLSAASMGADMADVDNDGYGEIFVTEMLPATNKRIKEATTFENWNRYQLGLRNDYYHQFTRNMLQRNNGDGTFTEIGRLSGVEATDWSWGALLFDMDNDGYKDLFVANGIYQDLTNRDFLDYIAADEFKRAVTASGEVNFKMLVDAIPSNPVPNAAFKNLGPGGGYRFEAIAETWGLDLEWFSNGSAYGDLDNDGDLDLVVNNTNALATVYRNHTSEFGEDNAWLQLVPEMPGTDNPFGVGTKATVMAGGETFFLEHMPMRGFQSTVDYRMHFGLGGRGSSADVDSVIIEWPDGTTEVLTGLRLNQRVKIKPGVGERGGRAGSQGGAGQSHAVAQTELPFVHDENAYSDFDRDPLLYHMLSAEGPALCAGRNFVYAGGARGQAGTLLTGPTAQRLTPIAGAIFAEDAESEDVACACFDADGDGDEDLYVVSGSSEFGASSTALFDRLYLNQGGGRRWEKSAQVLPSKARTSLGSTVVSLDVDGDGDRDLFVGGRMRPGLYGVPARSYLLLNDGRGNFTAPDQPALRELGMVTAAVATDDGRLLVTREWQAPVLLSYADGQLAVSELDLPAGWYNALAAADLNGDGRQDYVLGNHGLNSRFRAPVVLYVNDFDANGKAEQIVATYEGDKLFPQALLHDLTKQLPSLRKQYVRYESFGDQTIQDIFPADLLENSVRYEAEELRTLALIARPDGSFETRVLPLAAQETPVYALYAFDADGDGDQDILLGGNFYYAKPEIGRYDAGEGLLLINDGTGRFPESRRLGIDGQIRALVPFGGSVLVGRNDAAALAIY